MRKGRQRGEPRPAGAHVPGSGWPQEARSVRRFFAKRVVLPKGYRMNAHVSIMTRTATDEIRPGAGPRRRAGANADDGGPAT
jgi:hypothetical protein